MFSFPMRWVSIEHKLQVVVIKGNDVAKTKQKDILFVILSFMIFLSIRNDKSHEREFYNITAKWMRSTSQFKYITSDIYKMCVYNAQNIWFLFVIYVFNRFGHFVS